MGILSGWDWRRDQDAEIFEKADFIDSPVTSKQSDKSKRLWKCSRKSYPGSQKRERKTE